jgi:hypothetical protein
MGERQGGEAGSRRKRLAAGITQHYVQRVEDASEQEAFEPAVINEQVVGFFREKSV